MAEHTRGPWRVEDGTTLIWGACSPDDRTTWGMGYPVAEARVMLGSGSDFKCEARHDEAAANAALIAQAPSLKEENERLMAALDELNTEHAHALLADKMVRQAVARTGDLAKECGELRALVQAMINNNPDDMVADGVTVLDAWRKAARAALGETDS